MAFCALLQIHFYSAAFSSFMRIGYWHRRTSLQIADSNHCTSFAVEPTPADCWGCDSTPASSQLQFSTVVIILIGHANGLQTLLALCSYVIFVFIQLCLTVITVYVITDYLS